MNDIEDLLKKRGSVHGDWSEQSAISEAIWRQILSTDKPFPAGMSQALHMIATKLGRIVAGDEYEIDHWKDLAGYATLVVRQLEIKAERADRT